MPSLHASLILALVVGAVAAASGSGAADDNINWYAPAYFEPQQAIYLLGKCV